VAGVADAEPPAQGGEGGLVEDLGDQPHVLEHGDPFPRGDRDAGGFLAAVLESEEPVVGQLGHVLGWGEDPEDTTGVLRAVVDGIEIERQSAIRSEHRLSLSRARRENGLLTHESRLRSTQPEKSPAGAENPGRVLRNRGFAK